MGYTRILLQLLFHIEVLALLVTLPLLLTLLRTKDTVLSFVMKIESCLKVQEMETIMA